MQSLGNVLERGRQNARNQNERFGKSFIIPVFKAKALEMKLEKWCTD